MRAVSGKHWGANQKSLLMIYKALIWSVSDYGAIVYDNATESQLARLFLHSDKHFESVMTGTSLAIMQAHCGEMPPQLTRLKSQAEYCAKVTNTVGHVSSRIFGNHWTQVYGRFSERNQPITVKVSGIHDTLNKIKVAGPQLAIYHRCLSTHRKLTINVRAESVNMKSLQLYWRYRSV